MIKNTLVIILPLILAICFVIGCQRLFHNNNKNINQDLGYDTPLKPYEKDSLQNILKEAMKAKRNNDTIIEESLLIQLLKRSENKSRLEYWAANYHLGQIEYHRQNYRKAITYYNIAHSVDPTDLEIYHRANAYYSLGKLDSAVQDYNSTISFVKQDFIREFPNSSIAKCDTCGFPFGSKEYQILTENSNELILDLLKRLSPESPILKEIYDDLKEKE